MMRLSAKPTRAFARQMTSIAVHGGAWAIPDRLVDASLDGCGEAANAGWEILAQGGSALDAVEAAVRSLEENPAFDAGRGAVLNAAGEVELDAVIMDGRNLEAGAVAGIGPVMHPVSVARLVMDRTPHVFLVGHGATTFAVENGVELLPVEALVTPEARAEYAQMAAFPTSVSQLFNRHELASGHDTVGAVAIDAEGNLASATSTGGITFQRVGRVGDSPIIGSGCVADNAAGAISTTGHGESIMRYTLASRVLHAIEHQNALPEAACAAALDGMFRRVGGCGGAICLDRHGRLGLGFTTPRMAWAARSEGSRGVHHGIERSKPGGEIDVGSVEMVDVMSAPLWPGSQARADG